MNKHFKENNFNNNRINQNMSSFKYEGKNTLKNLSLQIPEFIALISFPSILLFIIYLFLGGNTNEPLRIGVYHSDAAIEKFFKDEKAELINLSSSEKMKADTDRYKLDALIINKKNKDGVYEDTVYLTGLNPGQSEKVKQLLKTYNVQASYTSSDKYVKAMSDQIESLQSRIEDIKSKLSKIKPVIERFGINFDESEENTEKNDLYKFSEVKVKHLNPDNQKASINRLLSGLLSLILFTGSMLIPYTLKHQYDMRSSFGSPMKNYSVQHTISLRETVLFIMTGLIQVILISMLSLFWFNPNGMNVIVLMLTLMMVSATAIILGIFINHFFSKAFSLMMMIFIFILQLMYSGIIAIKPLIEFISFIKFISPVYYASNIIIKMNYIEMEFNTIIFPFLSLMILLILLTGALMIILKDRLQNDNDSA